MVKSSSKKSKTNNKKFAVVVSKFNDFITKRLLKGCLQELVHSGIKNDQITVVWVPGSFEIPVMALQLAKKKNINAVICLGAVIRGETFHFELVARQAAWGIQQVSLSTGKPVIFGVLTTDNIAQAYKRSEEEKGDNKGKDAARAALDMCKLITQIQK